MAGSENDDVDNWSTYDDYATEDASQSQNPTRAYLAWPVTGGVWTIIIPPNDLSNLQHEFDTLLPANRTWKKFLEARNQIWTEAVRSLPGAVFLTDRSCDVAVDALTALNLPAPGTVEGTAGLPQGWPLSVERCVLGNVCWAWPKDGNGGVWFARDLNQIQIEELLSDVEESNATIAYMHQQAKMEVIQALGGVFHASVHDSPIVRKILAAGGPPAMTPLLLNELDQPLSKPGLFQWSEEANPVHDR